MMRLGAIIGLGALALAQPTMTHAEIFRWKCDYRSNVGPTGLAAEKFSLELALDTITWKAIIIGNDGKSHVDVDVLSGKQAITFQETLDGGAVQTTTITKNGSSVHSRHKMTFGKLTPSQYYGTCK